MYAASALAAIATAVLAGWIAGFEPLMSVLPGLVTMKPNTALAFLVAAAALYLAHRQKHPRLQAVCASFVALISLVTLLEAMTGLDAGIDQLVFRDPSQFPFPGRMALFTASSFLVSGVMLFPFRFRSQEKVVDLLALAVGFASAFAIVGYLYGVPILYGGVKYTAMAIHTGVAFLILSLGFLFIRRNHGFVRIFRVQTAGGVVVRWLVPSAILIPVLVGGVFNRFNFGDLRLGIAFIVACNILLLVASVWSLAWILDKSEIERGMARHDSEMDALTGVCNRRHFNRRLQQEIERCERYRRYACLILFDLDHFKKLNDRFGHQCGDEVLKAVAQACAASIRATDVICRYGGEEFAIIAPETTGQEGLALARKIRTLIAGLHFVNIPIRATVSLGVVRIGAASAEIAIGAADQALYAAKKLGRNRECLWPDVEEPA